MVVRVGHVYIAKFLCCDKELYFHEAAIRFITFEQKMILICLERFIIEDQFFSIKYSFLHLGNNSLINGGLKWFQKMFVKQ